MDTHRRQLDTSVNAYSFKLLNPGIGVGAVIPVSKAKAQTEKLTAEKLKLTPLTPKRTQRLVVSQNRQEVDEPKESQFKKRLNKLRKNGQNFPSELINILKKISIITMRRLLRFVVRALPFTIDLIVVGFSMIVMILGYYTALVVLNPGMLGEQTPFSAIITLTEQTISWHYGLYGVIIVYAYAVLMKNFSSRTLGQSIIAAGYLYKNKIKS